MIPLNESFMDELSERTDRCGYTKLMTDGLVYPPTTQLHTPRSSDDPSCRIWVSSMYAATEVNPCFNAHHLINYCPFKMDVMNPLAPDNGQHHYFSRSDVREAINAPDMEFSLCSDAMIFPGPGGDPSPRPNLELLPRVIEQTNNTILSHGWLDFQILANGTLLTIQNMTWNGAQGFQRAPTERLFVPRHLSPVYPGTFHAPFRATAGSGNLGTAHTERGLTISSVDLAGHGELIHRVRA